METAADTLPHQTHLDSTPPNEPIAAFLHHGNNGSINEITTQNPLLHHPHHTCGEGSTLHIILVTTYLAIAVSGIVGNILSFLVLHCKSCKNATNLLLKGLSLTDAVFGVCAILRVVFIEISNGNQCNSIVEVAFGNLFVRFVMTITQFVSVWIIVVLAFFRYMAICHPFQVAHWCNRHTAKRAFVAVFVAGVVIWAPFMLQYDIKRVDYGGSVDKHGASAGDIGRNANSGSMDDTRDGGFVNGDSVEIMQNFDLMARTELTNNSEDANSNGGPNGIRRSSLLDHIPLQQVNINVVINNELIINNGVSKTHSDIETNIETNLDTTQHDVSKTHDDVMTRNDVTNDDDVNNQNVNMTSSNHKNCYKETLRFWAKSTLFKYYDGAFAHVGSMFLIPFIPLIFFNAGMMRELYCRQNKNRERLHVPKRTNEVMEITKVVIAIVIVFVISYSMYIIYIIHIYSSLLKQYLQQQCRAEDLFFFAIRTVALLNSSVNFVIYYVLRKSFRHKVKVLLCACMCYKQDLVFAPTRESSHNGGATVGTTYSYKSVRRGPTPGSSFKMASQKRTASTRSKYS